MRIAKIAIGKFQNILPKFSSLALSNHIPSKDKLKITDVTKLIKTKCVWTSLQTYVYKQVKSVRRDNGQTSTAMRVFSQPDAPFPCVHVNSVAY